MAGSCVSLRVGDTGSGMTEEVAGRAFEPFFSTKPRDLGSGLGLATVYGIVAQAGGEIELDSTPGRGTVVEVRLPAAAAEVARSLEPARTSSTVAAGEEVVLLVEDEDAVREATRRILSRHGHPVISAACGEEALDVLAETGPAVDLLVTDVVMPDMSGRELAERTRQLHPSLGVVYISGYTDDILSRHGGLEPEFRSYKSRSTPVRSWPVCGRRSHPAEGSRRLGAVVNRRIEVVDYVGAPGTMTARLVERRVPRAGIRIANFGFSCQLDASLKAGAHPAA